MRIICMLPKCKRKALCGALPPAFWVWIPLLCKGSIFLGGNPEGLG